MTQNIVAETAIRFEQDGAIATITLDMPDKGNAIGMEIATALVTAAERCDTDDSIRCVVLTGAGRLFCAGGDIGYMQSAQDRNTALRLLADTLHVAVLRLAQMKKPLLCLVQGPAAGAGLSLAVLGDIVIAARSAHFTLAYGAIGLTPDGGASWLLPRLVGLRRAQELIITNRRVPADEAQAIGLVTSVVDDDQLAAEGRKMAETLARSATGAIGAARSLLLGSYGADLKTHLDLEARTIAAASVGAEGLEGVSAFLAKRRPDFAGNG